MLSCSRDVRRPGCEDLIQIVALHARATPPIAGRDNSSAAVRCSGRHFCTTRAVLRRNKSAGTGGPVLILLVVSLVANKALALLGEEIGMFVDRKELGKPGEFSRMSDEELEWFIQAPI